MIGTKAFCPHQLEEDPATGKRTKVVIVHQIIGWEYTDIQLVTGERPGYYIICLDQRGKLGKYHPASLRPLEEHAG